MKYYLITSANPVPRECGTSKLLIDEKQNTIAYNNITCFYEQRLDITDIINAYEKHNQTSIKYDYENYPTGELCTGYANVEEVTSADLEDMIDYVERG